MAMRKGQLTETGARAADRNKIAANWFSIARSVWNMHDALLIEQRRTNQLLEALIEASGETVPDAAELPTPTIDDGQEIDWATGLAKSATDA